MMSNYESPLYMAGHVIGHISIDEEDGSFTGDFDSQAFAILSKAMDRTPHTLVFDSIFGIFAHPKERTVQEEWNNYLGTAQTEFWCVVDGFESTSVAKNLPSREDAERVARQLHEKTGRTYSWSRQSGRQN